MQLEAGKTDLIIARTQAAADRLKFWQINTPIKVTADPAFNFHPEPVERHLLKQLWPEATDGVIGLAAVDFYLWPVVFRVWGRNKNRYRWPYYYSDSRGRRRDREILAKNYADFGDRMIEKYGRAFALICMEQLDEGFARKIQSLMVHSNKVRILSAREYNASQITHLLRSLELLITSRYHAGVLSSAAAVPQIAVSHDQRLKDLYRDFEIDGEYYLEYSAPSLFQVLEQRVAQLLQNPINQQELLRKNYRIHQMRARQNPELLAQMLGHRVKQ